MYANGLSPVDIGNALSTTNVVIPSGTARMGNYEYDVDLNMNPTKVAEFNQLPIKVSNGIPVFLGDVAPVSDTHQPQTNVVRIDGRPATFLLVIKHAAASTLSVVDAVRARIPEILAVAPKGLKVALTFDQSAFVRASLWEVVREAVIAAALVALMVLIFIGSPAQHADRYRVHPALDSYLDLLPAPCRPDDQHDDPGRDRACGRNAGR